MPQRLKDDVQRRIEAAALRLFARDGYRATTMAGIARSARVSTGNLYRYHRGKEALFDAVVPRDAAETFRSLMRRRVEALRGTDDLRRLPASARYHVVSEELLAFAIAHRLQVVVLAGHAAGTCHAGFADLLVRDLVDGAIGHFRALRPGLRVSATMRFNLDRIYRSFTAHLVAILAGYRDEAAIREAVAEFSRYHLAGLKALFS